MYIEYFMKRSISDTQSVENISYSILRSEVQPAQANVSTANVVVDSSSPIRTQLPAVHNNDDIGWYSNSVKAAKDEKKYNFFGNASTTTPQYDFKKCEQSACLFKKCERSAWGSFFVVSKG